MLKSLLYAVKEGGKSFSSSFKKEIKLSVETCKTSMEQEKIKKENKEVIK